MRKNFILNLSEFNCKCLKKKKEERNKLFRFGVEIGQCLRSGYNAI